jgi:hypothetical protein
MQKWEYCKIIRVENYFSYHPLLFRFTINGEEREDIPKNPQGMGKDDAIARVIAQLGEEGWELVGVGRYDQTHTLYFKRPKT